MSWILNILFALSLFALVGLELQPQWGKSFHQEKSQIPLKGQYSEKTVAAFLNYSFGSPNGTGGSVVRKWNKDIRIKIHGEPDSEDLLFLQVNTKVLDTLLGPTGISIIDDEQDDANMHIHFIPRSQFSSVIPQYRQSRSGPSAFWWGNWNDDSELTQASLLLDPNTKGLKRHNQILQLLMGAVGLMSNSIGNNNSVFADSTLTTFSQADLKQVQLLYESLVLPGMTKEQAQMQLQLQLADVSARHDPLEGNNP